MIQTWFRKVGWGGLDVKGVGMAFYRVLMVESRISSDKAPTYPVVNDLQRRNLYLPLLPASPKKTRKKKRGMLGKIVVLGCGGNAEEWQMLGQWMRKINQEL